MTNNERAILYLLFAHQFLEWAKNDTMQVIQVITYAISVAYGLVAIAYLWLSFRERA